MALDNLKCNCVTPLHFKALKVVTSQLLPAFQAVFSGLLMWVVASRLAGLQGTEAAEMQVQAAQL